MAVFAHGQMRLYLLALLNEGPRHGYEIIQSLEERFNGLYSPSAGTVYPRLAKLEEEGLVERPRTAVRGPTGSPMRAEVKSPQGSSTLPTSSRTSTTRCGSSPRKYASGFTAALQTFARSSRRQRSRLVPRRHRRVRHTSSSGPMVLAVVGMDPRLRATSRPRSTPSVTRFEMRHAASVLMTGRVRKSWTSSRMQRRRSATFSCTRRLPLDEVRA